MKVRNWTGMVLAGVIAAGTLCCGFGTDFVYAASENVEINTTNFPNAKFRKYIKDNLDKNKDDNLSNDEIITVTELDLRGEYIADITGIGNFTELEALDVSGNELGDIDVSNNIALTYLNCADTKLTKLDVRKNINLTRLICSDNEISSLDITNNKKLEDLSCYNNKLTTLNTSNNTGLKWLYIRHNNIKKLNLSQNQNLTRVDCRYNELTKLDMSGHTKLELLACDHNNLSNINLTGNDGLRVLTCSDNKLEELDLQDCVEVSFLDCSDNKLKSLDIRMLTKKDYYGEWWIINFYNDKIDFENRGIDFFNTNEESENDKYIYSACMNHKYIQGYHRNVYMYYNYYQYHDNYYIDLYGNNLLSVMKGDLDPNNCDGQIRDVVARDGKIILSEIDPDYGKGYALYESNKETIDVPDDANEVVSGSVTFKIVDRITSVSQITFDKTELKMDKGESKSIIPNVTPENATNKSITWSSNNKNVAVVDANGNVTAVNAGDAVITATTEDGGHTAECRVSVTIPVTGVTLDKTSATLNVGKAVGLKATVRPATATNKNISWSSDDEAVATVDKNGKVTAVGLGTAKITVTTEDGEKTEYCTVNVKPIEVGGVKIGKAELTLTEGDHEKLNVTVSPDNATNKAVTWKSSNTDIARVDDDGTVTAVSPGKAAITVTTADRGLRSTCKVTVTVRPVEAEGVYLEDTDVRIMEGETAQLVANIYPSDATNRKMTWKSSNKKVASVDANGKVTALKKGTAEITVTTDDGGYTDTARITVSEKVIDVTGISLSTTQNTMYTGDTFSLSANVTPQDATNKKVTWQSSNEYIAAVDRNGKVTAKNPGTVNITATTDDGGRTATAKIKVIKKTIEVAGLVLDKKLVVLDKGGREKLSAAITPDNADNKTVSWTSSAPDIATVDAYGNITALNNGTAVITAKTSNGKTAACEIRVNFADVASESLYYYKPVYWAADNGITTGANGLFAPHNKCTREHAITFLWRMAGSPAPKSMTSKFKDIQNKNSYSYKAIMWGTENGIITGANGVFAPNNTCTREQIVTMLWRLAGKPEPKNSVSKFKDVQNKNSYSYKAILWAAENGVTTGANGSFAPGKVCTRAEIVTFIYRYRNMK